MKKIVFLDRASISPQTTLRAPDFPHELRIYDRTTPGEVGERIKDADIVMVNKVRIQACDLEGTNRLGLIAVAATGTDNIDLAACASRGVAVSNIRNYAGHTVPEHTFALIFALRRSILAYHASVRAGRWQDAAQFCYFDYPIRDLAGSTLGIVGDGILGNAVAAMGRALGMKVLFSGHKGRTGQGELYTPFEQMLAQSDIITLHCPLLPTTRNMIGAEEFAKMKKRPLLINTARGGLVDEAAVGPALAAGHVSGAGFDVTSVEPPPPDHPFMALLNLPNFILTPHVAWASDEATQGLADQLIGNIEAFVQGTPRNLVGG
ncbi:MULTISPECIES: D-2-hydroxyacid dehydrogenase [unclassified Variovorax]|uniref:D-2-hydroxyacid dehydrogenase n=1 Tax=unclassified Variovorax TaxID=663243 RepID=UPI002576D039|nr:MULTISPECIES: D-2-hydroxyacid dehydrogenase [unclassified Variovorax]MDM0089260.1 D-2-hydroxyacid dehydrogenase [Variovorax sp. J22G40]MDM0147333.1 D-2-hydroxyacid dehydrogenase [Variovorax sp. J2P1-31]